MRSLLPVACLTFACTGKSTDSAGTVDDPRPPNPHTLDHLLTWSDLQVLGTHNSTHIQPAEPVHDSHYYTHPPLDEQLDLYGVRGFELDVHLHETEGWQVFHLPLVDDVSTCLQLSDCLSTMLAWSDAHPWHLPLMVWLEPKDGDLDAAVPELLSFGDRHDELEQAIVDIIPRDRIFTPDDLRGSHATLPEALAADGAPTLDRLRDRFIFSMLDSGDHRDAYLDESNVLEGRLMFADADGTEPWAAVIKKNDATSDPDHTRALVEAGFFVSSNISDGPEDTQAEGAAHLAASLEAGAQVLKVDRAMPADGWSSEIPGGAPARCNPVTAPADCSAAELESLYP